MNNKQWNTKLNSLLHSLDIKTAGNIDEIKRFGKNQDEVDEKLLNIMSSYIEEMHDELVDKLNPSEMDEFEASQEEKDLLNSFFSEISKTFSDEAMKKSDALKQWDSLFTWFEELLFINEGQFRLMYNENNELMIIFKSDKIKNKGKTVSITDELIQSFKGLNGTIYYSAADKNKKSAGNTKKPVVKKKESSENKVNGKQPKTPTDSKPRVKRNQGPKKTKDKGPE